MALDMSEDDTPQSLADNSTGTIGRLRHYILMWERQGYEEGIPDEVPMELMRELLAPSYKAIVWAILKNDMTLKTLGFIPPQSKYYGILKRIEVETRSQPPQLKLF